MKALELFAGGGGAALGLHAAGICALARVEWDRDACATLRAAIAAGFLDDAEVIEGDVRAVDYSRFAGVDLLWASPPCQCWSTAGKRLGARDERNGWPWTWAAIDAARPRWFIAENVAGMLHHRGDCSGRGDPADCPACWFHRVNLPEIARRFPWCGWAVLDAADYGVPQNRRRVYVVAGPRPVRWPEPTHADPDTARQGGLFGRRLLPWVTVREALGLDTSTRAVASGIASSDPGTHGVPRSPDMPSPALQVDSALYLHGGGRPVAATVEQRARLMAWPDGYPATVATTGNGCTPPVVTAIARAVMDADATPSPPPPAPSPTRPTR